jgi:uncharacterized protein YktA (UPF0223 family)
MQLRYYENLLKKYGKGRERKTEIRQFRNDTGDDSSYSQYQTIRQLEKKAS